MIDCYSALYYYYVDKYYTIVVVCASEPFVGFYASTIWFWVNLMYNDNIFVAFFVE